MTDTNVFTLAQPGTFADSLTEILRNGARALLTQAVETEVVDFLGRYADLKTEGGHQRVVRHGHLPERAIMTGIGPVAVRQPRIRDREAVGDERIRFSPTILPPYARRTKSLEVLIPILYLKGISTGDLGVASPRCSARTLAGSRLPPLPGGRRLGRQHTRWRERDLYDKRYAYVWADGIYVQARLEDDSQCLVLISAPPPKAKKSSSRLPTATGRASNPGRPAARLKQRGLKVDPKFAIADGALGFWAAIDEVWPRPRAQRCWVHKTANARTSCRRACSPPPNTHCRTSGWPPPGRQPRPRSLCSSKPTAQVRKPVAS